MQKKEDEYHYDGKNRNGSKESFKDIDQHVTGSSRTCNSPVEGRFFSGWIIGKEEGKVKTE
jgi:hypothetical protein